MSLGRVLVTGSHGMLSCHIIPHLKGAGSELCLTDLSGSAKDSLPYSETVRALDITDAEAVRAMVETFRPNWIVNCAAYTSVDDAETRYDQAFQVNAVGPANLARAAKEMGAKVLHISTDYVFGASSRKAWPEDGAVKPCGVYGYSKQFGDDFVSLLLPQDHLIVRTSWLHGIYGPNFVRTILRAAKEKSELRVVEDQIGSPTWAEWLAVTLVELMKKDARGFFHATSRGDISWFQFAQEIVQQAGLPARILPQTTAELGRPAPRPAYSTLDVGKLERFLGTPCPDWRQGIREHLSWIQRS